MQPEYHLGVSAIGAAMFYYFTGSLSGAIALFCAGFWIDLDHFVDYWIYKKKIVIDKEFFSVHCQKSGKLYIILHSVELLWILWFLSALTRSDIVLGLAIGMAAHLLMDVFGNEVKPFTYFLVYRILVGFKSDRCVEPSQAQHKESIFKKYFK